MTTERIQEYRRQADALTNAVASHIREGEGDSREVYQLEQRIELLRREYADVLAFFQVYPSTRTMP